MRDAKTQTKKYTSLKGRICANINMNNPNNPFVPKGTLLDLQDRRRKQFKLAVFCALSVGVVGLTTMLGVQGCKRENPSTQLDTDPGFSTNVTMVVDTNTAPAPTNTVAYNPPVETNVVPTNAPPVEPAPSVGGSEYKIQKGDTLAVIAKKHGVSWKAIEAANPKLNPKRLKIGETITIPASSPKSSSATPATSTADGSSYTVKPGDSLGKIAKAHGTTANAIKAANSLKTDRINIGQKLVIPTKSVVAPAAPAVTPVPEPVTTPPAAPALSPIPPTTVPSK